MLKTPASLQELVETTDAEFDAFIDQIDTFEEFFAALDMLPTGGLDNSLDI